jgi:hypothetical protein
MSRIDWKEEATGFLVLLVAAAVPVFLFIRPFRLAAVLYGVAVVFGLLARLVQTAFEAAVAGFVMSAMLTFLIPAVRQAQQKERARRAAAEAVAPVAEPRLDHTQPGMSAPKPETH